MNIEVGTTEFVPKTSLFTDFDNHTGLRRTTTDFEVGRCASPRGGFASSREWRA
jgi:hypothetical protein